MQNAKVRVGIAVFAYAGNGGYSAILPELAFWMLKAVIKLKDDPRVSDVVYDIFSDTPITMTRNKAAKWAKETGCDFLLMLDSDNLPDYEVGRIKSAEPFLGKPFDFAYDRLVKRGLPTVIFAPYCGPPPHPLPPAHIIDGGEVPYLFQWTNTESDSPDAKWKVEMLNRREAARLEGIHPMAAGPTGVCMFATKCWEGMKHPHFYYEWNEEHSEKRSTEDVTATRDIAMYWQMTKGEHVVFAAMDSWALHYKPKKVGKPRIVTVQDIGTEMREAILGSVSRGESVQCVDFTENLPAALLEPKQDDSQKKPLKRRWEVLGPEDDAVYISDEEWQAFERQAALEAGDIADTDIDVSDAPASVPVATETYKSNGHALRHKMIGQRKVAILDRELSDESIENLQSVTNWLVGKLEGGIDVAVIHPGTGQGTSAILSCLPSMSRLLAFDSTSSYYSGEYAKHFNLTFEKELESGIVKADVDSKAFPVVKNYAVDMAFIENFVTAGKLATWLKAVSPKGVLCGAGYENEETRALVDKFAAQHELPVQVNGDIWVIPVGGIANVAG